MRCGALFLDFNTSFFYLSFNVLYLGEAESSQKAKVKRENPCLAAVLVAAGRIEVKTVFIRVNSWFRGYDPYLKKQSQI